MTQITQFCHDNYELSMLSTDENEFYEKLGWHQFKGESFVQNGDSEVRTEEEDEDLMWLPGIKSRMRELRRAVCQSRSGDSW